MKKLIIILMFIIPVLISYSQEQGKADLPLLSKSTLPLSNLMKMQQSSSGDTLWLYHRYDINEWKDGEFHPYLTYIFDYYTETVNIKYVIIIQYNQNKQDTTLKLNYFYDENNRITSTITQNYNSNIANQWINYKRVDQFYNLSGLDSLFVRYIWDGNDSLWEKHDSRGFSYDNNGIITIDSSCMWNGQEWEIYTGSKNDFLYNEYGNVYDWKRSFYNNSWVYDSWGFYYLTNDSTGEYNSYDIKVWVNGQWENYERWTEVVLHNWQGFTIYSPEMEHLVLQFWDNDKWIYAKKDSTIYDTLGGATTYVFLMTDNNWQLSQRYREAHNEKKLVTYITYEEYINNQWDTIWGSNHIYEYLGSIWKVMKLEEYDTTLMEWVPTYDHVLSDFTYILNTEEIETDNSSSNLQIIPNPTKNSILIKLNDESDRIKSVRVYNITGQRVLEKSFHGKRIQENLNVSSLKNGVYILTVTTKDGKTMKGKVIKE